MTTGSQNPSSVFDRTGFPMIHIPRLNAWLGWLPVTMVQLEYFLCDQPDPKFDNAWYQQLEHTKNRVTPHDITDGNLYRLFATQMTPADIERYCEWLGRLDGELYRLPTAEEWITAYRELQTRPPGPAISFPKQQERTRRLLENVRLVTEQKEYLEKHDNTLRVHMLMVNGVKELTATSDGGWCTLGRPQVTQKQQKRADEPDPVPNPRIGAKDTGFRILRVGG